MISSVNHAGQVHHLRVYLWVEVIIDQLWLESASDQLLLGLLLLLKLDLYVSLLPFPDKTIGQV